MNNTITEDMILQISAKADRLKTIAWLAGCAELIPAKSGPVLGSVLLGISDLSESLINDLDELANIASGVHAV